jgi:hypothetical protein
MGIETKRPNCIACIVCIGMFFCCVSFASETEVKRRYYWIQLQEPPLAHHEPYLGKRVKLDLQVPFSPDGDAGFMPSVSLQYPVLRWLAVEGNFSWLATPVSGNVPANIGLEIKAGACKGNVRKSSGKWNGCIIGALGLGMGFFDMSDNKIPTAAQGLMIDQRWWRYSAEHFVIEPVLILGVHGGTLGLIGAVGPSFGLPVYGTDTRSNKIGLLYAVMFSANVGLVDMGIGFRGISEFTGDELNSYALEFALRHYVQKPRLMPWIRVTIPIYMEHPPVAASLSMGIAWHWDKGN